jgi:AraC-like DNA-binding protein
VHRIAHPAGSRFLVLSFSPRFLRPELDIDPLDLDEVALARVPELAPFLFQEYMDFSLKGGDLAVAREACRNMLDEYRRHGFCSMELIRANLVLLIGTVCRRHEEGILRLAAGQAQRRSRRDVLSHVTRYLRENLTGRIGLQDVAAAVHLSPNYLAHLLKKESGKTFVEIVTERRMEKARELLRHSTLRIAEIAAGTGFDDEAYFARRFKQLAGVTPRDYRAGAAPARRRPQ